MFIPFTQPLALSVKRANIGAFLLTVIERCSFTRANRPSVCLRLAYLDAHITVKRPTIIGFHLILIVQCRSLLRSVGVWLANESVITPAHLFQQAIR